MYFISGYFVRYNRLLAVLKQSLNDLLKALKGLVVLSQQLEEMANSIFNNQVPSMWAGKAYPSLKPLAAWVTDLVARVAFIQDWIDNGIPPVSILKDTHVHEIRSAIIIVLCWHSYKVSLHSLRNIAGLESIAYIAIGTLVWSIFTR